MKKILGLHDRGGRSKPGSDYQPMQSPPPSGMSAETIRDKVAAVSMWWHSIDVGHGMVTPGRISPEVHRTLVEKLGLSLDLSGKTALDIGAWDGYYSFEMEKRKASRVVAIDNYYRKEDDRCQEKKGFEVAKEIRASKVDFKNMDVYELSPDKIGEFDIVLFLGVLYHLRHPLLALERIASVTKDVMILESYVSEGFGDKPVAVFFEKDELNNDPTNWWGPNPACLLGMVRSCGFERAEITGRYGARVVIRAYKKSKG